MRIPGGDRWIGIPGRSVSAVAERLRLARQQAGLSQGQVARMLSKHRPTISEIEAGRRRVSADELAMFADIYEVSPAWLLGREDESDEFNERVRLAARELAKLRAEDLDRVLSLLSSMREATRHQ
ncbi:MAG: helix-turn-helix transcriptional regulator [Gammaproteobacteria bacterium]|nr:helix-turn-helix transcriptional regulator [Gammaproteobacteria bacterium]MDE0270540.1 helix-turn-helix transcriptional regulator [Gammaproteobacteria bacterium]